MVKQLIPAIALVLFLSSCSAFKSLNLSNNRKTVTTTAAPTSSQSKFIEDISITPQNTVEKTQVRSVPKTIPPTHDRNTEVVAPAVIKEEPKTQTNFVADRTAEVETANAVQLKYAVLLNTEVEYLPNKTLLENVDEWYGVRYRTGGNTKTGVDCSGFTVAVYLAVYGIALPRVSREQYRISRKISITELQEGDLVFFKTSGRGVSHVGVYLGNNKFIHASVSRGVMVNSLFESYYVQRFIGAGRIDDKQMAASSN
jgi:cell wall-associated NlpC family hydrolase